MGAILEIDDLSRRFGGLTAVRDLSFAVEKGTIHGLIGPNGAGKTTTFNVVSGYYAPTKGRVLFEGADISGLSSNRIASLGLVRTFQQTTLFQELSVFENVLIGCHIEGERGVFATLFGRQRNREHHARERTAELLDFFGLSERAEEPASNLPHGIQRALGIAVGLAAEPRLIMLDEPFTGMNPEETRAMSALVRRVRERGVTILLVEHDMQAVMDLCDRITVLNFGSLLAEGTPEEIRAHPEVIEAYLGASDDVALH